MEKLTIYKEAELSASADTVTKGGNIAHGRTTKNNNYEEKTEPRTCCDAQNVVFMVDKEAYYKCRSCGEIWYEKDLVKVHTSEKYGTIRDPLFSARDWGFKLRDEKEEKTQGKKTKEGKLRWDLLPYDALEEVVKVMTSGVKEYGERNWELGISYADLAAAMQRHFVKWFQRRIDLDEKTNLPNLAHLIANAMYLLAYQIREMKEFDDRPGERR